jgi:hypothetical protein
LSFLFLHPRRSFLLSSFICSLGLREGVVISSPPLDNDVSQVSLLWKNKYYLFLSPNLFLRERVNYTTLPFYDKIYSPLPFYAKHIKNYTLLPWKMVGCRHPGSNSGPYSCVCEFQWCLLTVVCVSFNINQLIIHLFSLYFWFMMSLTYMFYPIIIIIIIIIIINYKIIQDKIKTWTNY